MRFTPPGRYNSPEAFQEALHRLDATIGLDPKSLGVQGPLGAEILVHGKTLANRFAIHPMEGWDASRDGAPTEHTLRRWKRFGESGAALIWGGEAFAVEHAGRANPNQLFLGRDEEAQRHLADLLGAVRTGRREHGGIDEGLFIGLQLTHSGRFAQPDGPPEPKIAYHHPVLDARSGLDPCAALLTDGELEAIGDRFVDAARVAEQAGFDFVDVKCCHGYLLHELLSARRRAGPYGGSFENRTRLFVRIVEGIRAECKSLAIGVRVSVADSFPFLAHGHDGVGTPHGIEKHLPYDDGFGVDRNDPRLPDFEEPIRFLRLIESLDIRLVNVSLGSPYYCPHLQRPAAFPPSDGYFPPFDPLLAVIAHLKAVRICKAAVPGLLLVGSGYSYLQEYLPHVAQYEVSHGHVDFVGLGRMVLSNPHLPADFLAGRPLRRNAICRTFSDCTTAPRNRMISGCYPLDDYYKTMPHAKDVRALRPQSSRPTDDDEN